jgi:DNA-binding protein Fis
MVTFEQVLDAAIRKVYVSAYLFYHQNQTKASKALGVSRGTFISKMKKWGELK